MNSRRFTFIIHYLAVSVIVVCYLFMVLIPCVLSPRIDASGMLAVSVFSLLSILGSTLPLAIQIILLYLTKTTKIGYVIAILLVVIYFAVYLYLVYDAHYTHPDALSLLVYPFMGICCIPFMLPVWLFIFRG